MTFKFVFPAVVVLGVAQLTGALQEITVYQHKTVEMTCNVYENLKNDNVTVKWFDPDNEIIDSSSDILVLSSNDTESGVFTCVVYSTSASPHILAIEDIKFNKRIIDVETLYKDNFIAAIIAATSFVLLVLLAWLVWTYRWKPSPDDGDGTEDGTDKKGASSKTSIMKKVLVRAKLQAARKRRKKRLPRKPPLRLESPVEAPVADTPVSANTNPAFDSEAEQMSPVLGASLDVTMHERFSAPVSPLRSTVTVMEGTNKERNSTATNDSTVLYFQVRKQASMPDLNATSEPTDDCFVEPSDDNPEVICHL